MVHYDSLSYCHFWFWWIRTSQGWLGVGGTLIMKWLPLWWARETERRTDLCWESSSNKRQPFSVSCGRQPAWLPIRWGGSGEQRHGWGRGSQGKSLDFAVITTPSDLLPLSMAAENHYSRCWRLASEWVRVCNECLYKSSCFAVASVDGATRLLLSFSKDSKFSTCLVFLRFSLDFFFAHYRSC